MRPNIYGYEMVHTHESHAGSDLHAGPVAHLLCHAVSGDRPHALGRNGIVFADQTLSHTVPTLAHAGADNTTRPRIRERSIVLVNKNP